MKVTLISPYPAIASMGLRDISFVLKGNGYNTHLTFLPNLQAEESIHNRFIYQYNSEVINQLVNLCNGLDLIGRFKPTQDQ
jgi:hypothetical protein